MFHIGQKSPNGGVSVFCFVERLFRGAQFTDLTLRLRDPDQGEAQIEVSLKELDPRLLSSGVEIGHALGEIAHFNIVARREYLPLARKQR